MSAAKLICAVVGLVSLSVVQVGCESWLRARRVRTANEAAEKDVKTTLGLYTTSKPTTADLLAALRPHRRAMLTLLREKEYNTHLLNLEILCEAAVNEWQPAA
jgi:hypothetical protein